MLTKSKKREETFIVAIKDYGDNDRDKMKYSLNKIWSAGPGSQWVRKAKRNLWHEEVGAILDSLELEPFDTKVDLTYRFCFRSRYLDSSNCAPMGKLIEDTLVTHGILRKDTNDCVGWVRMKSMVVDKKLRKEMEEDYVEVTITESDDDENKV